MARAALAERSSLDDEIRTVLPRLRPSPVEIASLWPADRRERVFLVVSIDAAGNTAIQARTRDEDRGACAADLLRRLRRVRNDVPVVFDWGDGRSIVVPLRALG